MAEANALASGAGWIREKTQDRRDLGINLLIDQRQGYLLHDVDGTRLIDVDLSGGMFNLGHRNPELVETLSLATRHFDMGDHQLPCPAAATLAEALAAATPGDLQYTVFGASSAEVRRIAVKAACQNRPGGKIVSTQVDAAGQDFISVPYNDIKAMEDTLARSDIAAVILETLPQDCGLFIPTKGYLQAVKGLSERYGALYIADETRIGLMQTGQLWAITGYGVQPDILLIGNGLAGGMYPVACAIISEQYAPKLQHEGYMQTSGTELGCIVAHKALEIYQRNEVRDLAHHISDFVGAGLARMQVLYSDFFTAFHQQGLVMGLEFVGNESANVVKHLFQHGVWANMPSDMATVLPIKPGILMSQELAEELLLRVEAAIFNARQDYVTHNHKSVW